MGSTPILFESSRTLRESRLCWIAESPARSRKANLHIVSWGEELQSFPKFLGIECRPFGFSDLLESYFSIQPSCHLQKSSKADFQVAIRGEQAEVWISQEQVGILSILPQEASFSIEEDSLQPSITKFRQREWVIISKGSFVRF